MREIGGYLELEQFSGSLFHDNALALNCGRSCLEYLILAKGIRKIFLPCFCCDSISQPCRKCGVEIVYYHIDFDFRPVFDETLASDEWLYIVNYYGQISNSEVEQWKWKYGNIIFDNAQAYFQVPVEGVDTLYTCRKFLGVADGGFLYTDARELFDELETDESFAHMRFVLGRYERSAGEFYQESADNNHRFANESLKQMSKLTRNLLRAVDYDEVVKRRTENFTYLHEHLGKSNKLRLTVLDGAYMYPLYCENGAVIRKAMQKQKIFIPTLWPEVLVVCNGDSLEYDYALNILPLPVDQRYVIEDMEYLDRLLHEISNEH